MAYNGVEDVKHMYGREKAGGVAEGIEDVQNLFDDNSGAELEENGNRVKTRRFEKSLNSPLIKTVMARNYAPHVDMRVVVVYSFSCDIYQGDGGVTKYATRQKAPKDRCRVLQT